MLSTERGVISGSDYYVYTPSAQAKRIFLYPINMGLFRYEPGYSLHRNSYDSFLIMFIRRGECQVETGGRVFHAGGGQVVILNCFEPHAYWTTTGWEAEWLHFDGMGAAGYYDAILDGGPPVISLRDTYRLEKYLHKIYLQFRECISIKEALLNNYIVNILTELLVNRDFEHSENVASSIIEDTIAYINEHLTDPLTLKDLADQASLSPFYFSRLFKKESGFSPHEYVIAARVNNAKFLLKSLDISIKDICFSTGFTSESSFCTTFKKVTGITPSEYRFSIRN
ncbi:MULTISPECIES: AraC family transcriptional regulator [Clostridia]|uniref:AraC family transcriptional regulator n=1 Tax=Lacrimispora celerecrescens TaxID=29354 RepID=A0A084JBJ2_9FIRM|nr:MULTISPECIES: AraC family transcriptional regulator [Clostridia]KEZ86326.1 AraC family transcriptional regulator [Lacrimispora celerecrescens]MBW4845930.1 AraC family transcriptional regulator [Lachnospiraceae bacterium]MSS11429.1 AraC family transcriptional regulator [Clostridium sp. WB02_MRS01]